MENLVKKRGSVKAKITFFNKFVAKLDSNYPSKIITDRGVLSELQHRLERVERLLDEFEEIQIEIEQLTASDEIDKEYSEREDFETSYFESIAKAKAFLVTENERVSHHSSSKSSSSKNSIACSVHSENNVTYPNNSDTRNIKYPTISLPFFKGESEKWLEFRETFNSLVVKCSRLDDVMKFHYLRSSLGGEASKIITNLEFSPANFSIAWDLICKRYNNNRILVQNHVKSLFNLDKIHEESSHSLRKIIQDASSHLRALEMLQEPTNNWDTLIIYLIVTKLDSVTTREWEEQKATLTDPATFENLYSFLENRADLLESIEQKSSKKPQKPKQDFKQNRTKSFVASRAFCVFCKKEHYIQDCPDFIQLGAQDRFNSAIRLNICINCFRRGHDYKNCRSGSCKHCKSRHNSLLHGAEFKASETTNNHPSTAVKNHQGNSSNSNTNSEQTNTVNLTSQNLGQRSQVLLSTVVVNVIDRDNKQHLIRALLDPGSQSSFATQEICDLLQLKRTSVDIKVGGINAIQSEIKQKVSLNIKSQVNNYSTRISCLVVPQITGTLPNFEVTLDSLQIPSHIQLADPKFHIPNKIDLLLGADCFWDILCVGRIKLKNGPMLQKTKFGYVVAGPVLSNSAPHVFCNFSKNVDLDNQFTRFWELEEVPPNKALSKEEKLCESHFLETTKRDEHNRFIVSIPLLQSPEKLGDSLDIAKKRFFSLERKFQKDPELKSKYSEFIHEYISLDHMRKVNPEHDPAKIFYVMPHHGVKKESSLTTKLRVVFDASCPTTSGVSFNQLQAVGPTIQPELLVALIRHRKYNFVIIGDIEKMYRMCRINPAQTSLQRIFWRDNPQDPLDIYELQTVTYGTAAASYLAIRCLYQIGVESTSPIVSDVIKNHFYVDDYLSGGNTVEEVVQVTNEVIHELSKSGFKLRKFVSNSPNVLLSIKSEDKADFVDLGTNENTKTLGMLWNGHSDCFTFKINEKYSTKIITKRSILSEVSQIFDPLGLLSPCIIIPKMILQNIWMEKVGWDDTLPNDLRLNWLHFREELTDLNELKISRQVTCKNPVYVEIHGFSDASTSAYGACVYAKSIDKDGNVCVRLITSKSKVAPLKTQTVPRLELTAALCLAKLVDKVISALVMRIDRIVYWTDSSIVLGWLHTSPSLLQTFVSNRVSNIQELTNIDDWHHVPSSDNPADYVSRGVAPSRLMSLHTYWNGPSWLLEGEASWPSRFRESTKTDLPEMRKVVYSHKASLDAEVQSIIRFENYSNLTRLERTVAYCIRFISNCQKSKADRVVGPLSAIEIAHASKVLVKISQAESFSAELKYLLLGEPVKSKSKLNKLNPFLDENNIIRVGGRISNSKFEFNKIHPVVLSSKHVFTKLLFQREHIRLLHAGPQQLLATLRDRYWPISGRNLAKQIVHQCTRCFRVKPKGINPIMGNLPRERITPSPPFSITGVDYMGPLMVKDRKGRGCKISKCYACLFICFSSRAIHLELVTDLTKEAFIAAFRRFVSRRGLPARVFSDNGTNFVSASKELQSFAKFLKQNANELTESFANEGISWSFIPAYSPHMGGLWESGVKSTKHHLRRVAGNAILTFEQLYTLLVQVEAVLNSRPMSPLSSDPSDFTALTPSHFLIGRPLTSTPDQNLTTIPQNRLSHFEQVQQLQQHFWTRWSREFISELQQRTKWSTEQGSLKIQDLVIIKEDNQPPLKWVLGRIVDLYPGKDKVARVAAVRTPTGIIKRSFSKICPLPVNT